MAVSVLAANGSTPSVPPGSYNMLMNAISSGATEAVRQLIAEEPELINMFGWHRQTALHRACLMGYINIVKLLLDGGADPNARNNFDETPLHYACKRGLSDVLCYVLDKGGDVSLYDKMGKGPAHHAAESGNVAALHLLECRYPGYSLSEQDTNLQTPLHLAVKAGKIDSFLYLLKKQRSNLKSADKDGNWPIHISAQQGHGYMTWSQLCMLGLSALHVLNKHGCTPYDLADMNDTVGHKKLVSELNWLKNQWDQGSVKRRASLLWFYYLLFPLLSYAAAIIITRVLPAYHALVFFPVVIYNVIVVKNNFHRLDHISRWPQPIHAGAFAAGLFHTALVYFIVIMPHMDSYPMLRMLSFLLGAVLVAMYLKLLTKDPGVMTSPAQDQITGKPLTFLDVCSTDQWTSFCNDCEMVQPQFTKHCRLCERCMLEMDHHCLFLLRCIARDNHVLFVWFILLCLLCMTLFLYSVFIYIFQVYSSLSLWGVLVEMATVNAWVFTMALLNLFSIVWGLSLLAYQYKMISNGYTAYFRPKVAHKNLLSRYEKFVNVVKFLMNRKAHAVNPSVFITEKTQVV